MTDAETQIESHEEYVPRRPRRHRDETARLGEKIYERDIRQQVLPRHIGEFMAIDVDSASWALGKSTMEARERLGERTPEAVDVLMKRIGYEAVGSVGGGSPRRVD